MSTIPSDLAQYAVKSQQGPPKTLPANFTGWDKPAQSAQPPATLPANFDKWDVPDDLAQYAVKTAESEQPSAASRFSSSFASGAGVTSAEGGKQFFTHPIDTLWSGFERQGGLAKAAADAYKRGDYMEAATHALNYMVPFIGQQTDVAGQQLQQGDIAGGVGRTLGVGAVTLAGTPEGRAAAGSAGSAVVRGTAKTANAALKQSPRLVGASTGAAIGHATGIPGGGYIGAMVGESAARALASKLPSVPGESFGISPYSQADFAAAAEAQGREALASQSRPTLSPAAHNTTTASGTDVQPPSETTAQAQTSLATLHDLLNTSLGGRPLAQDVPLRDQIVQRPGPPGISTMPPGHTPVTSSAVASFRYLPDTQELEVHPASGSTTYRYGDVSPEQAAEFQSAKSVGKAWQNIRQGGSPLVAKRIGGKWVYVKPSPPIDTSWSDLGGLSYR